MVDKSAAGDELLGQALDQLKLALNLLDGAQAPGQIAAHVDLAIHQLRDAIEGRSTSQEPAQIAKKAELH